MGLRRSRLPKVTLKSLVKKCGSDATQALSRTNSNVVGQATCPLAPDVDFCRDFGIDTNRKERRRWQVDNYVTFSQSVAEIPSNQNFLRKINDRAHKQFQLGSNAGPDDVVLGIMPDGRVLFRHSWEHRFQQCLLLLEIQPHITKRLAAGIHVYRPGKSHLTALLEWRERPKKYRFQRRGDFQRCFPSLPLSLVEYVLRDQQWISEEFVDCIISSLSPAIVHLPQACAQAPFEYLKGGTKWKYTPRIPLTGAPLIPALVTFVLSEVVFKPLLEKFGTKLRVIVCADDFLLMGTSAALVDDAMAFIVETLRLSTDNSLKLHSRKTMQRTVDVTKTPIAFLKKSLHNKSVNTPQKTREKWAEQLVALYSTGDFGARAIAILDTMTVEDQKSLWRFHGFILRACGDKERGKAIVSGFKKVSTLWSKSKTSAAPKDCEYLDILEEGETVNRLWARPLFGKLAQEISTNV